MNLKYLEGKTFQIFITRKLSSIFIYLNQNEKPKNTISIEVIAVIYIYEAIDLSFYISIYPPMYVSIYTLAPSNDTSCSPQAAVMDRKAIGNQQRKSVNTRRAILFAILESLEFHACKENCKKKIDR